MRQNLFGRQVAQIEGPPITKDEVLAGAKKIENHNFLTGAYRKSLITAAKKLGSDINLSKLILEQMALKSITSGSLGLRTAIQRAIAKYPNGIPIKFYD